MYLSRCTHLAKRQRDLALPSFRHLVVELRRCEKGAGTRGSSRHRGGRCRQGYAVLGDGYAVLQWRDVVEAAAEVGVYRGAFAKGLLVAARGLDERGSCTCKVLGEGWVVDDVVVKDMQDAVDVSDMPVGRLGRRNQLRSEFFGGKCAADNLLNVVQHIVIVCLLDAIVLGSSSRGVAPHT